MKCGSTSRILSAGCISVTGPCKPGGRRVYCLIPGSEEKSITANQTLKNYWKAGAVLNYVFILLKIKIQQNENHRKKIHTHGK